MCCKCDNHEQAQQKLNDARRAIDAAQDILDREVMANYSHEERGELLAKYDSMFGAMAAMRRGERP